MIYISNAIEAGVRKFVYLRHASCKEIVPCNSINYAGRYMRIERHISVLPCRNKEQ